MTKTNRSSLKLPADLRERIETIAKRRNKPAQEVVDDILERFVSYEEQRDQMWKEANEAIEEYDRTGQGLTHQQVVDRIAEARKQRTRDAAE